MNKKYFWTLSLMIIASVVLSACQLPFVDVVRGSGNLVTETREVSGFNKIRLDGAGRLVVTQGSSESLEIEAEDNIIGELTSDVQGDTLILGFQDQPWQTSLIPTEIITYNLMVTDLTDITFNGAGDFTMDSLETSTLNLDINGAGQYNIADLMADSLSVEITGTGTISIGGQVETQTVDIDGAGNYQAGDLETTSTEITINGLGNGTVWATDTLEITINGAGNLNYYGNPSVTEDVSGAGDINNQGEK